MKETLEHILRRFLLPINDRLVDVSVTKKKNDNYYHITYMINDRIDYHDSYIIERETNTLFDMLAPDDSEAFKIRYHSVADD